MPNINHVHTIHELLCVLYKRDNWNEAVKRRFQTFYYKQPTESYSFNFETLLKDIPYSKYLDDTRNKDIFCRFWGIGCDSETLQQISADYGISGERVRQIKAKVVRILQHPSRKNIIRNNLEEMGFFF
jgi:DNA-directed RNA polymerase sigma subunit (sigma70/sigma32)